MVKDIELANVRNAAAAIDGCVERTPFRKSVTLSGILGLDLYLKFENLQFTASFKERGALNRLLASILMRELVREGRITQRDILPVMFVPLTGDH